MKIFLNNPSLLIREFNEMAAIAQGKAFITVGVEIQKEEIEVLKSYRSELKELKGEFVKRNLESEANLVYCVNSSLLAVQYEIEMLVNIKEDKMSDAWGSLVNAQLAYGSVIGNYPFEFQASEGYIDRLVSYEKLLFPKLYFQSVGGIIRRSHCSICGNSFSKCNHVKGKLYMGELCCLIITQMDLEEISFVENPANKHCRVLTIEYDGRKIDVLTLREQITIDNNASPKVGLTHNF
jgi:hypothetical protein